MSAKRGLTYLVGPALAVVLLWLSFRGVDFDEVWRRVRHADPLLLSLNLAAAPLHLLLRSWRWRSLLREVHPRVPMREAFTATSIGYLAGVLPGRVGEILRPTLLSRRVGIPFAPTLATAGVERVILDLLVVLVLGALALWLPPSLTGIDWAEAPDWVGDFRRVGGLVFLAGLASLAVLHALGRRRGELSAWLEKRAQQSSSALLGRVLGWLASLMPGLATLAHWRGLAEVTGQTLLIWAVTAGGMHAGIVACGVDLPPAGMLVLLPILVAGISIPTPGNTGTFHLAMKLGLVTFYGVAEPTALGVGLVVHLCNWLPLLVLGGVSLAVGGSRATGGNLLADTSTGR